MPSLPPAIVLLLSSFASLFDARTWRKVQILLTGVILAPGRRTVSTALYVLSLQERGDFTLFNHVLSRASWSSLAVSRVLLDQLVRQLVPTGPLRLAVDETLERCWGGRVERDPRFPSTGYSDSLWGNAIDDDDDCTDDGSREQGRNRDFQSCWDDKDEQDVTYTVEWPFINPDDDFEITGYCQRRDEECAEELTVCYNANDCDDNSYGIKSWSQVGELWEDAGSCLYDDDEDEVWECIDEALDNWLDDNRRYLDDYDDLETHEEEDRGFVLEDYEDDLDDVGDRRTRGRVSETVLERYQRQWNSRTPVSIYRSMDDVETRGPSFRLTADE